MFFAALHENKKTIMLKPNANLAKESCCLCTKV